MLPPDSDDTFFSANWWWLTIIGLTLIALIATIALLQPQNQGFGSRVAAGAGARSAGRQAKPKAAAAPSVGSRVRRTKVAQSVAARSAQPKPPKPSMTRRFTNWVRDTEIADSYRARSGAKRVKSKATRKKPPKIKRRR